LVLKASLVENEINRLLIENLYRTLKNFSTFGSVGKVNGRKVVHLSSNDYLGLSRNAFVIRQMRKSITQISQSSSRLIAGNDPKFLELENELAEHRMTESSLIYPTGYMANLGIISSIADKSTTIFSDEFNHASIVDGCKLSGAKVKIFRHNDISHLEELIRSSGDQKKVIATEGVFSIDGDIPDLRAICRIAKEHDAITLVDDAHGDFIFGSTNAFSGIPSHLHLDNKIDIHVSSLSKALGCFGGYVACNTSIIKLLVNKSRQFIYTSALPEYLCTAASYAMSIAKKGKLQQKLFNNINIFSKQLRKIGIIEKKTSTQIIPMKIGPEKLSIQISEELLERGIFAPPIRYPSVKKGSACIRFCITSLHDEAQLLRAIDGIQRIAMKYKLI
jgi:glycine C-acetyltransferase